MNHAVIWGIASLRQRESECKCPVVEALSVGGPGGRSVQWQSDLGGGDERWH